jgi:hypothetical protein
MDTIAAAAYRGRVEASSEDGWVAMSEAIAEVEDSVGADERVAGWMARNLVTQGYCLEAEERRRLRLGLRFPTGLCLPLVALALALESPVLLLALTGVGTVAGLTPRHPFDLLWNHGVRHIVGAPRLPPNPIRRRHAFKIGTVWLLAVAALFQAGVPAAALALGGALIAACALVTATNFCVPSYLLSVLGHPRASSTGRRAGA